MSTIDSKTKPGVTIRVMREEYYLLDEFMGMVKQKIQLDMEHSIALKKLKGSWNPKWQNSAIWPLVSPMLTFFREEIEHRQKAEEDILARLNDVPETQNPVVHSEDDFNPLGFVDGLERSYNRYQTCHQNITTTDSMTSLKAWYSNVPSPVGGSIDELEVPRLILPEIDRKYRQAVTEHQRHTSKALKWYSEGLLIALEEHQQRAENMKSAIHYSLRGFNELASKLSASCSAATSANRGFASTTYIGRRHDEVEREKGHPLLRPVHYRNYMKDGGVAQPICGLSTHDAISSINMVASHVGFHRILPEVRGNIFWKVYMDSAFELERILSGPDGLQPSLESPALPPDIDHKRRCTLVYTFLSGHPLFPLEQQHVDVYQRGIPRGKISVLLDLIPANIRQETLRLMFQFFIPAKMWTNQGVYPMHVGVILTHKRGAGVIIRDIWRKWDFEQDRPLPQGVERNSMSGTVTWVKTGVPYT